MECSWSIPTKAHRLLNRITEHPDIFTRNENGEAVVYGDTIPGSNFKSLFKSMVSYEQNLNQVGDEGCRALKRGEDEARRERETEGAAREQKRKRSRAEQS